MSLSSGPRVSRGGCFSCKSQGHTHPTPAPGPARTHLSSPKANFLRLSPGQLTTADGGETQRRGWPRCRARSTRDGLGDGGVKDVGQLGVAEPAEREGLGGRDIICSINSLPVGFRERKNIPFFPPSGWFTDCTAFLPSEMQRLLARFGWAGSGC